MLYQQTCHNINIEYHENLIKITILQIPNNNIEKYDLYMYVLDIFKLNKVNMIIEYFNKEYSVFTENDLKIFFKKF